LAKRTAKKVEGWKAKQWYNVLAPELFGRANIGTTPSDDPSKLIGRVIETTLGELVNDWSKQNIKMMFKIENVAGDNCNTSFIGHELTRDYIRSLVKRRTSKIDSNVVATTADGKKIRVKSSCFTTKRAHLLQIETIRKIMERTVLERAKLLTLDQFIQELILGKVASDIYKEAKTIYPLRRVEITKSEIEPEHKVAETAKEAAAAG
jgi:small subunit ribosomal protein S3Ae